MLEIVPFPYSSISPRLRNQSLGLFYLFLRPQDRWVIRIR